RTARQDHHAGLTLLRCQGVTESPGRRNRLPHLPHPVSLTVVQQARWGRRFRLPITMPEPIIKTTDLTRRFGDLTAVDRLRIDMARGEIFGLVGPDGAGKTTRLRILDWKSMVEGSAREP